jgi:hypothetical protein
MTLKVTARRAGEISPTQNIHCLLRTSTKYVQARIQYFVLRTKYWIRACTNYIYTDLALKIMLEVQDWREIK